MPSLDAQTRIFVRSAYPARGSTVAEDIGNLRPQFYKYARMSACRPSLLIAAMEADGALVRMNSIHLDDDESNEEESTECTSYPIADYSEEMMQTAQRRRGLRRVGTSDPLQFEVEHIPLTAEDLAFIQGALQKTCLHFSCTPREMLTVSQSFGVMRVPARRKIFNRGELCTHFFVVATGSVVVTGASGIEETWGEGTILGLEGMISLFPYIETAFSGETKTTFYVLEVATLRHRLRKIAAQREGEVDQYFDRVPMFQKLTVAERKMLSQAAVWLEYPCPSARLHERRGI